jgi:outer membrane protein assembly factor BamB
MIEWNGAKRLVIWTPEAISSLDPSTGIVIWSTELKPGFGMATAAPRLVGDYLFATGAGRVSALLSASTGEIVWGGTPRTSVGCSISTPIVDDGIIYGNDAESGTLVAAKLDDGERLWQTVKPIDKNNTRGRGPRNATVFIIKNGDQYFLFNDSGELILAKLSAEAYMEVGRASVLRATNFTGSRKVVWSHPAFANKCMFARNDEELVCVSLAAE